MSSLLSIATKVFNRAYQDFIMLIRFVDGRPDDFSDYVSLPHAMTEEEIKLRLVPMLSAGVSKLHIPEAAMTSVVQQYVMDAVAESGYRVSARPLLTKAGMAEFFFELPTRMGW